MDGNRKRKKSKRYYVNQAKKAKQAGKRLAGDLRGFLGFTNNVREREALREAYDLLNQCADKIYGPEAAVAADDKDEVEVGDDIEDEDEDVEKALAKEKAELDRQRTLPSTERRFQCLDTGVKNVLFVRTLLEDPVALGRQILEDLESTRQQRTRYLLRLLPVEATCKASAESLEKAVATVVPRRLEEDSVTYCVAFKSRMSSSLGREDVIRIVTTAVKSCNPSAKVEYKSPKFVIVVEVVRGHCCLSILPRYFELKKYNVVEVAQSSLTEQKRPDSTQVDKNEEERSDNKSGADEERSADPSELGDVETPSKPS